MYAHTFSVRIHIFCYECVYPCTYAHLLLVYDYLTLKREENMRILRMNKWVDMCVCTHFLLCVYACTYAHLHMFKNTCMQKLRRSQGQWGRGFSEYTKWHSAYIYIYIYIYIYTHTHMYIHIYMHMTYMCIIMHMNIWLNIHACRNRGAARDSEDEESSAHTEWYSSHTCYIHTCV